ncbi:Sb48 [Escherichia coli]
MNSLTTHYRRSQLIALPVGHGQGGMGTKAHDLFVLPLCRKHHDELHADTVAFEEKYGSQLELIFRFIDRALAIGVLA